MDDIEKEMDELADDMASIVNGEQEPANNWSKNDWAFWLGYRFIDQDSLGTKLSRRLSKNFEQNLIERGVSSQTARAYFHEFWIYFWSQELKYASGFARWMVDWNLKKHTKKLGAIKVAMTDEGEGFE